MTDESTKTIINASEGMTFRRKSDGYIMGRRMELSEGASVDDYDEVEWNYETMTPWERLNERYKLIDDDNA